MVCAPSTMMSEFNSSYYKQVHLWKEIQEDKDLLIRTFIRLYLQDMAVSKIRNLKCKRPEL